MSFTNRMRLRFDPVQAARSPCKVCVLPALAAIALAAVAGCGGRGKPASLHTTVSSPLCNVPRGPAVHASPHVSVDRNVSYGSYGGQPLLLDVYRPAANGQLRPAVLVVHSGGWVGGDKSAYGAASTELAKAGLVAFDANYTLAAPGRPGWPLQVQELRAAVRWIRSHAASYGVDPTRIGALGGSSGANLVELVGDDSSGSCTGGDRVAAVVAWSGPTDLRQFEAAALDCFRSHQSCADTGFAGLVPAFLQRYLGCAAASCQQRWSEASPITHVSSGASPTLLLNSAQEVVPLSQVQAFSHALAAAGVPQQLIVYPGSDHAEMYAAKALPLSITFLARYLEGR
jgi:acetyl esterase/lipase